MSFVETPGKDSTPAFVPGNLKGKNLEVEVASKDSLDVRQFSVHERMSSLFQVNLIAMSDDPSIDFDRVVGQPARFALNTGKHDRFWTGICNHFEQVRIEPSGLSTYQLSIVPPLWLLTQRKNYRMFQQIAEPDIVLKILNEWGIEPEVRIDKASYKKRKYRVQYAESDFAFVSRMLEDAGIGYYFEQAGDETKLVLSDAPQGNPRRSQPLTFLDDASMVNKVDIEFIKGVRVSQRVRPGKYTMRDHDYRRPPSYNLMSSAAGGKGIEEKLERFHYTPGAFLFGAEQGDPSPSADDKGKARTDEKEAAVLAQKRLDAKRGSARVCTFETNAHDLAPGVVMNMVGHQNAALGESQKLLIVESSLSGTDQGEWSHRCEARGTEVPFRPKVVTPKPKVNGVESATVVGPAGEEIHTDEFGRVRVHFHWDRESQMDDNSSCWIHVSQSWGGAGYGGTNLPRIGQEVLVDFLGGDPDRPVIVGRVYTNLQKTPYKLPDNKTQSGWKSNSTGGGGGYNEVMFEDAQGKELVNIQAQKDLKKLVKNNEDVTIGNNRTKLVKANDSLTVGASRTKRVQMNEHGSIGMNKLLAVGINRATQIGAIDSTTVGDTHVVSISPPGEAMSLGSLTRTLMKEDYVEIGTTGGAKITLDGKNITIEAGEGGEVIIKGGPMVKINPAAADAAGPNDALDNMDPGAMPNSATTAEGRRALAESYQGMANQLGQQYGVPPALVLGLMSRESGFGTLLAANGTGDHGHGFGILQIDNRSHVATGGAYSYEHGEQAMGIFNSHLDQVRADHPTWTSDQQLAGGVAAYNFGADDVHTQPTDAASWARMDDGTTDDDYSRDVWAQAQWFADNLDWSPRASRLGDLSSGHDSCPEHKASLGSPDVYWNDKKALRVSDTFVAHSCPAHASHEGAVQAGSKTVMINDELAAARVMDPVSCGGNLKEGSPDVLIGD